MGSRVPPSIEPTSDLAQRVAHLETQALAWQLLINSLLRASQDPQQLLEDIERDVMAWRERDTPAARSPASVNARAQVLQLIEGLRDVHRPTGYAGH